MLTREVPKQQTTTLFSLKILIFYVNWLYKSKVRISVILHCRLWSSEGMCSLITLNTLELQQGMPFWVIVTNPNKFGKWH